MAIKQISLRRLFVGIFVFCSLLAGFKSLLAFWHAASHNTLPIRKFEQQIGDITTQRLPKVRVVGHRTEYGGECEVIDLVLLNPMDVPITYCGYGMGAWRTRPPSGEIGPLYSTQIKVAEDTNWHNDPNSWLCGNGAGPMIVPPKHAGRFDARVKLPLLSARIGIECEWTSPDGQRRQIDVWSEDVTPTVSVIASASAAVRQSAE